MSVTPWFAQPEKPLATAILLPGRQAGVATPLLHWPASLLTEMGWSVLCVSWNEGRLQEAGATVEVYRCAEATLAQVRPAQPVLVVAKSLGTLALPWAVENGLPGVWLTPLLQDRAVVGSIAKAQQPTLLVGGTKDPHWQPPVEVGSGVTLLELPDANHGLQELGQWRRSLLRQVEVFDRLSQLAERVLRSSTATDVR
jgi:pimeloyl-ACP methyl ester carboxylesterase